MNRLERKVIDATEWLYNVIKNNILWYAVVFGVYYFIRFGLDWWSWKASWFIYGAATCSSLHWLGEKAVLRARTRQIRSQLKRAGWTEERLKNVKVCREDSYIVDSR
jgi:hypothetical protein